MFKKAKSRIKEQIKEIANTDNLFDQINTLHYYLNNLTDIKQFPKAKGDLGLLQQCDFLFLCLLDRIFKKYGLNYWLDWGTLLGCYRHNGFIPWDDDLDIAMMKDDYEKAKPILTNVFNSLNIGAEISINSGTNCIGVGIMHNKTGIWCDIFPYESLPVPSYETDDLLKVESTVREMRKLYKKQEFDKCNKLKQSILISDGHYKIICACFETRNPIVIFKENEIFPLNSRIFESDIFSVPNNVESILTKYYGDTYMNYPKKGILSHGKGRKPLSQWAAISGTDMNEIKKMLIESIKSI